ncbi:MAG TPA: hypothetical protein PLB54_00110 [Nitrosomonas sp.]|nr:hypothetical protein [Nitrosomonas sp.]
MSQSIEQLRKLTDDEVIALHDIIATRTDVGVQFYLDEINRREQNKQTELMVKFTKQILRLTIIITVLTVINLVAVIIPFIFHS